MPSTHAAISAATTRTPARTALASHLQRLHEASEAAATARQQFDRACDQVEHGEQMVRNAEAPLAALDAKETEQISKTWPPAPPSAKAKEARSNVEDALAHARRVLDVAQQTKESARGPADQAAIVVRNLTLDTDPLIDAVLREEGMAAVTNLAVARAALIKAGSEVDAVRSILVTRRALREAEAVAFATNDLRWPASAPDATQWHRLAERLRGDANAVVGSI